MAVEWFVEMLFVKSRFKKCTPPCHHLSIPHHITIIIQLYTTPLVSNSKPHNHPLPHHTTTTLTTPPLLSQATSQTPLKLLKPCWRLPLSEPSGVALLQSLESLLVVEEGWMDGGGGMDCDGIDERMMSEDEWWWRR